MALNAGNEIENKASGIVVKGTAVEGGYFVTSSMSSIPSYAKTTGQLCYCTGDSKFYQYNGTTWVEKDFLTEASLDTAIDTALTQAKASGEFDGAPGKDGADGATPTIEISADGYWVINSVKTEYKAIGVDGKDGTDGEDGIGITEITKVSSDGLVDTYEITYTDGTKTTFTVTNGAKGKDGVSVTHSFAGTELTLISASGTTTIDLKGAPGKDGEPFRIAKVYDSITAMYNDYDNDAIPIGAFVVINTGDVQDEANAQLYIKGNTQYDFLMDLSGATGLKGEDGTSVTIKSITTSNEAGGANVVTFSNDKTLTVKNGKDGVDGTTPTIEIGADGYWVINGTKTEYKAIGTDGAPGDDGVTPTIEISNDGYWVINSVKTEYKAIGADGATPTIDISDDGYWVINGVKTEYKAVATDSGGQGVPGEDGKTPTFKLENGELMVSYDEGASWTSLGNIQSADSIKPINTDEPLKFFVGTQEQYNALEDTSNLFALITDDPTKDKFEALENDVAELTSTISTVESDVSTLNSSVSALESNVGTLTSTISTVESDVDTLTSTTSALESTVGTLESTVNDLVNEIKVRHYEYSNTATLTDGKIQVVYTGVRPASDIIGVTGQIQWEHPERTDRVYTATFNTLLNDNNKVTGLITPFLMNDTMGFMQMDLELELNRMLITNMKVQEIRTSDPTNLSSLESTPVSVRNIRNLSIYYK